VKPTPTSVTRRRWQRQHVNRDDTPKRPFSKKKSAEDFLKRKSGMAEEGNVYLCEICNKWHIGHKIEEKEEERS